MLKSRFERTQLFVKRAQNKVLSRDE